MKTMILLAKTAVLALCLFLLSISSMAQDRNSSGQTASEITQIQVVSAQPAQPSKADMLMNSETSTFPRPVVSGNRDLDIENFRVQLYRWVKENSSEFLALDEATRDLINNQQYATLFDLAVNRMKGNTQNEK